MTEKVFVVITGWFCVKCHCYNPEIRLDFELPSEFIPKKTDRECGECGNVARVKLTTKSDFKWRDEK